MRSGLVVDILSWSSTGDVQRGEITALINRAFREHTSVIGSPRVESHEIHRHHSHVTRATLDDVLVGVLLFSVDVRRLPSVTGRRAEPAAYIGLVSVAPSMRRNGVGRALINATCAHAGRILGAFAAYIETVDAFGVVGFFESTGFSTCSMTRRTGCDDGVEIDHVHLVMKILL